MSIFNITTLHRAKVKAGDVIDIMDLRGNFVPKVIASVHSNGVLEIRDPYWYEPAKWWVLSHWRRLVFHTKLFFGR